MAGFDPTEIENGTGLATALVYDDIAACATWLGESSAFAALGSDALKKDALLRATRTAERSIRARVRLVRWSETQGLIFPGLGAYDASGRLMSESERPQQYRWGIFQLAEAAAAGRLMPHSGAAPGITGESSRDGSISYASGTNFAAVANNHPEAWDDIRTAIPAL